jgi:hypothetical protein
MDKICGVYKITAPSGKVYIGESEDIVRRFNAHKNSNCNGHYKLNESVIEYGIDNHKFEIIMQCKKSELKYFESCFQEIYRVVEYGLNMRYTGRDDKKGKASEETKIKQKENMRKSIDKSKTSSKYFGVCWDKRDKLWMAIIFVKDKSKCLGYFKEEIEAHNAVQKAEYMIKNEDFSFMEPKVYSSKYVGVNWSKKENKWKAYVYVNRRQKHLGLFDSELEAYNARKKAEEMIKNNDLSFFTFRENSSKHKGVHWNKSKGKWEAYIYVDKKAKYVGAYKTEIEAIEAIKNKKLK